MGRLRDALRRRRREPAQLTTGPGLCDVCNLAIDRADGYRLDTRTVVTSEPYWTEAFTTFERVGGAFLDATQVQDTFSRMLVRAAGDRTAWLVCESCSELFLFDRDAARGHVRSERVDPGGCVLVAAVAWHRVFDRWPPDVAPPAALDTCDYCGRQTYETEMTVFTPQDRAAALSALGAPTPTAALRQQDGVDGWVSCYGCAARNVARLQRAEERRPGDG